MRGKRSNLNDNTEIKIAKAVWLFCSYLFVPQWGRMRRGTGKDDAGSTNREYYDVSG